MAGATAATPTGEGGGGQPWYERSETVGGLLLDISGVLYDPGGDSGGGVAIPGSVDAVKRLKDNGVPIRFCTNETQITREQIAQKLQRLGFDVTADEVFPPAPAVAAICQERGLRPHLLVCEDVLPEFAHLEKTNPNCVVLGDAMDAFNYKNLNSAFKVLTNLENPVLISMGKGKYYKHGDGLMLDVGPFMKALEYASDTEAEVAGKPSKSFFLTALKSIKVAPENAVMIGDDIVNDVAGAQACGLKGVQVRTGKFRPSDEPHPYVTPDGYVDNLAQAVDLFLGHR